MGQSDAASVLAAAAGAGKEEHDVGTSGDLAGLHRRIRELEVRMSATSVIVYIFATTLISVGTDMIQPLLCFFLVLVLF